MGIKLSHNKCGASEFVLIEEEKKFIVRIALVMF